MPYGKHHTMYPAQFAELFERACANHTEISIPCESNKEANSLRMKLYSYRKTLEDETRDRYNAIRLEVRSGCLVLTHQDRTRHAQLISQALAQQTPVTPVPDSVGNPGTDHDSALRGLGFDSAEEPETDEPA